MANGDDNEVLWRRILSFIGFYWRAVFSAIWPLISLLVLLLGTDAKIRCLFVVVWMAGYWVTECIPLYVTGLMPVVLMPMLSIQHTKDVCLVYFNKTNMLFMASMFLAATIQFSGLHNRIALTTIKIVGCSPRRLHFGLTAVTMFLSMWLVNSATTAMMCPIISAILAELNQQGVFVTHHPPEPGEEDKPPRPTNISMAYYFAAAYASTIGGIGSIVGTGTNLTYKNLYETRFPDGNKIEFVEWLLLNAPQMLIMNGLVWIGLQIQFMGLFRKNSPEYLMVQRGAESSHLAAGVIGQKLKELGPMKWNEIGVGVFFISIIILWVTRKPQFVAGWGNPYEPIDVSDATPALLVIILMIIIPSSMAFIHYFSSDKTKRPTKISTGLVTWKYLQEKMPWGLIFLLGGGSALAEAGKKSGMSSYLGDKLSVMDALPFVLVMIITNFLTEIITELTANVAVCSIIIPVLMEMSVAMKVHPSTFTYPAAVCCSFAFLLPVGTPPNAIISTEGNIKTTEMMKAGLLPKLITWIIVSVSYPTYGLLFFDQTGLPAWAKENATTTAVATSAAVTELITTIAA